MDKFYFEAEKTIIAVLQSSKEGISKMTIINSKWKVIWSVYTIMYA